MAVKVFQIARALAPMEARAASHRAALRVRLVAFRNFQRALAPKTVRGGGVGGEGGGGGGGLGTQWRPVRTFYLVSGGSSEGGMRWGLGTHWRLVRTAYLQQ